MNAVARTSLVREAESWLKTPYHHEAMLKGCGVDCGKLLIGVYGALGYIPLDYPVPHYSPDFMLHRDDPWYLEIIEKFSDLVEDRSPRPGDIVMFKLGRLFAHGGIIVEWPEIIHAWVFAGEVARINVLQTAKLKSRERRIYSPFGDG